MCVSLLLFHPYLVITMQGVAVCAFFLSLSYVFLLFTWELYAFLEIEKVYVYTHIYPYMCIYTPNCNHVVLKWTK